MEVRLEAILEPYKAIPYASLALASSKTLSCTVVDWNIVHKPFPMLRIVWPSNSFFSPVRSYYSLTWKKDSMWVGHIKDAWKEDIKFLYDVIEARSGQNCKWKIASGSFMVKLTQYVKGKPFPQKVWVVFDRWYSVKFVEAK